MWEVARSAVLKVGSVPGGWAACRKAPSGVVQRGFQELGPERCVPQGRFVRERLVVLVPFGL